MAKFKVGDRVVAVAEWCRDPIPRTITDVGWHDGKPVYFGRLDGDVNACGPWFEEEEIEATAKPFSNPHAKSGGRK